MKYIAHLRSHFYGTGKLTQLTTKFSVDRLRVNFVRTPLVIPLAYEKQLIFLYDLVVAAHLAPICRGTTEERADCKFKDLSILSVCPSKRFYIYHLQPHSIMRSITSKQIFAQISDRSIDRYLTSYSSDKFTFK